MTTPIRIQLFEKSLAKAFHDLNIAWIERFFEVEDKDRQTLESPEEKIVDKGGEIFFAIRDDDTGGPEVLGTVAMIPADNGTFELAKMAVTDAAQGLGIGKQLGEAALSWAWEKGASEVFLETNSKLKPALALYDRLGFEAVDLGASPYARCNVKMVVSQGKAAK